MDFQERKSRVLASLTSADYTDKSPKGFLDAPIISLIDAINDNPSYYTTSSCSGRISILSQPRDPLLCNKKKARGGSWLFITHDPADPAKVIDILFGDGTSSTSVSPGELVFRFEPFILAVECKDADSAQGLVSTAISCGFRESGITSIHKRVMVAIRCSIRLEVPLGDSNEIRVSPEYVQYLIEIANEKMVANKRRTDHFLQALQYQSSQRSRETANEARSFNSQSKELYDLPEQVISKKEHLVCAAEYPPHDLNHDNGKDNCDTYSVGLHKEGLVGRNELLLSAIKMKITGEPVEKLFLWGQSACKVEIGPDRQILVFGGFGGVGQHTRRNDTLMLDPLSGRLRALTSETSPSPRLGHTSTVVGEQVFIIGGRADPTQILNDVWTLNVASGEWKQLDCWGSAVNPRHRHAAAAVGSNIYVFGGLNGDVIYSSMHILDTKNLEWSHVSSETETWPCARHSHSLVARGTQLFMFGGYDGEKALGDLYRYDVDTRTWEEEKMTGQPPFARFSHSMFIYKHYIGIVGGCPIKHHFEEIGLLNLHDRVWMLVKIQSISRNLWIRGTTSVVQDDLVTIGGGASCYAFGTKFNEPMTINLLPLISAYDVVQSKMREEPPLLDTMGSSEHAPFMKPLVLQLAKRYGKLGKDILKNFGWLDLGRKVYCTQDELYICLPITGGSHPFFQKVFLVVGDLQNLPTRC